MNRLRPRRGQPLIALGAVLLGWVGLRAALWEEIALPGLPTPVAEAVARVLPPVAQREARPVPTVAAAIAPVVRTPPSAPVPLAPPPALIAVPPPASLPSLPPEFAPAGGTGEAPRVAAAHQLAWMAGVAQLPMPRFVMDRLSATNRTAALMPAEARQARVAPLSAKRWSADGWLLLRQGGVGTTAAGLPSPSYGASQAGAVIRYRLAPASAHRPALYLRASSAVQAPRGEELALGLSARPLARVPVALQAELRATQQARGTTWRPAVGAVTELPRFDLPAGLSGEVYAQAGYVGGPGASAFVDGQLRIERRLARLGRGELRAGLGAWGGAQKGANRVDVGPSATLDFPLGGGQGRVSADWRLRAAGNAAPKSGPAITLSAGF
ncbi:MAG: hypothetical protein U9R07_09720 [Pseudomonadota bacterium]|nr:hypothetical protein [Pseudomonadota bacterium]